MIRQLIFGLKVLKKLDCCNMKTAILLCGLVRNYEKTYRSFLHAFSNYEHDTYMHTWILGKNSLKTKTNSGLNLDSIPPDEEKLKKAFNLKKIKIDVQDINLIPGIQKNSLSNHPNIPLCYHESIKRCFTLLEDTYDLCVVVRPDLYFYDKINFLHPEVGKIYVPYINNLYENKSILQKLRNKHPDSVMDMLYNCFAYGTQNDMTVFSDFTKNYVNVCHEKDFFVSGEVDYNPDRALAIYAKNIRKKQIVEFRTKHGIQRENNVQIYSW